MLRFATKPPKQLLKLGDKMQRKIIRVDGRNSMAPEPPTTIAEPPAQMQKLAMDIRKALAAFEKETGQAVNGLGDAVYGRVGTVFGSAEIDCISFPLFQLNQLAELIEGAQEGSLAYRHFIEQDARRMGLKTVDGKRVVTNLDGITKIGKKIIGQLERSIPELESIVAAKREEIGAGNFEAIMQIIGTEKTILPLLKAAFSLKSNPG